MSVEALKLAHQLEVAAPMPLQVLAGGLSQEVVSAPIGDLHSVPHASSQSLGETAQAKHLHAVPAALGQLQQEPAGERFINTDSIPELLIKLQEARHQATRILGQNRQLLHNGGADAEAVPKPVDALGTARQVVDIKRQYGENSPEFQEAFTGLVLDSERLLGEAYRKNKPESFAKTPQQLKLEADSYMAHGLAISPMVQNGLSPLLDVEEQGRRINDYAVEKGTYVPIGKMIGRLGLKGLIQQVLLPESEVTPSANHHPEQPSISVFRISECTDKAIEDYKINPKGSHGGYVPAVEKVMIGGIHYIDDSGDRYEDAVGVPGLYITHEIIGDYMAEKRIINPAQTLTKQEVHATGFLSVHGTKTIDIVRELDQKASKVHGKNIFMGEVVPEDHPKDYQEFVKEAAIRRIKLAPKPTQLAHRLIKLEEDATDGRTALVLVDRWLKDTLLEVASKNPEMAEAMFDKATAEGFRQVAHLEALGRTNDAQRLDLLVREKAPEVSYCGGGSGGCPELDDVDPASPEGALAKSLGLKGKMVHNKVATCKNCSAKRLHHDYNGNTVCTGCKSTKLSGQGVVHDKLASLEQRRKASQKSPAKKKSLPTEPGKLLKFPESKILKLKTNAASPII